MRVFHQPKETQSILTATAVAIGNFDGCHLGHAALLDQALEASKKNGLSSTVLTFSPHPVEVLNPNIRLARLTTASEKLALFEEMGFENVVVIPFDRELAQLSPEAFFTRYLVDYLSAQSIHVGFDFSFGRNREGTTDVLQELCKERGITLEITPPIEIKGKRVSSSDIRTHLLEGAVAQARTLLGRPYIMLGQVVKGDGRGRELGFPTANLNVSGEKLIPGKGVYLADAIWHKKSYLAVVNLGQRPTFTQGEAAPATIEAHLIDFNETLYDDFLRLDLIERLRDERRFDSVDALKAQIHKDIAQAQASRSK